MGACLNHYGSCGGRDILSNRVRTLIGGIGRNGRRWAGFWFNYIILAIQFFIAYDLNINFFVFIPVYQNNCNILCFRFTDGNLENKCIRVAFFLGNHFDKINFFIQIQIQVVDFCFCSFSDFSNPSMVFDFRKRSITAYRSRLSPARPNEAVSCLLCLGKNRQAEQTHRQDQTGEKTFFHKNYFIVSFGIMFGRD